MRRFPIIPTVIVAGAVAVMIGLGVWQLQRAGWKERMLADLSAAPTQPVIDLDTLPSGGNEPPAVAFRRAAISCAIEAAEPELRAGRNRQGASGYSAFVPCRPGAEGWLGRLQVDAGWTNRLDPALRVALPATVAGRIGTAEGEGPIILTADTPAAGLQPSAPPTVEDIPNNHLAYAFQWFFFAGIALLIYLLALRRRRSVAPPTARA